MLLVQHLGHVVLLLLLDPVVRHVIPEHLFLLADNLLQLLNLILFAIKYIFLLYNVRLNFCGGERQGGGVVPILQASS